MQGFLEHVMHKTSTSFISPEPIANSYAVLL